MSRFANGYKRIVHFHIAKTGGTSLNSWLDTLVSFSEARPASEGYGFISELSNQRLDSDIIFKELGRRANNWWLISHDHCPGINMNSTNSYRFVIIRDPIDRILSQLNDWKRLKDVDVNQGFSLQHQSFFEDLKLLNLSEFIKKYHASALLRDIFNNYQTAMLAQAAQYASNINFETDFDAALWYVNHGVSFAGITNKLDECIKIIASNLGVVPQYNLIKLNSTSNSTIIDLETRNLLISMNDDDMKLYEIISNNLSKSIDENIINYSDEYFESCYLQHRLKFTMPIKKTGQDELYFDMNGPLNGRGYYGRDAAGTKECQIWLGPTKESIFYIPVPESEIIYIRIYISGYMDSSVRTNLKITVDGNIAPMRFIQEIDANCYEVIQIMHHTTNNFAKIQIDTHKCFTLCELNLLGEDNRSRSVSVKGIGYKFIPYDEIQFFKTSKNLK